mgnify:CR=1 FL=1
MDVVAVPKTLKNFADSDKARKYRNRQRKINYHRDGSDRRRGGRPWLRYEVEMILERRLTDREVARILGRSVAAVQVKRARLKREQGDS